jgi:hypothetical protein
VRLTELAGAAIAFVVLKRLTDAKPTVVTPTKPLIQQGFVTGPAATGQDFSILPTTLKPTQVGPSIDPLLPTAPIKQPSADIPKFVPLDILGVPKIDKSKLPPPNFTFKPFTGLLSAEAQANIARYQKGLP